MATKVIVTDTHGTRSFTKPASLKDVLAGYGWEAKKEEARRVAYAQGVQFDSSFPGFLWGVR